MKELLLEGLQDPKFFVLEKCQLVNLTGGDAPTYADINTATIGTTDPTKPASEDGDDGRDRID
ncbi:MAG: hypothetical protein RR919_09230 [Bacteroidales bacterium]